MREIGEGEHTKTIQIESARGTIFDRNLKELAISIEVDSIYAHPSQIEKPYITAVKLAKILRMNYKTICAKLTSKEPFVWIKRKVPKKQSQEIKKLNVKGINFLKEYKRFYPENHLAAHLIGFVGLDNKGLEGVELAYDRYLRGGINKLLVVRDGEGKTILDLKNNLRTDALNGNDIILTIDEVIQHYAELELKDVCNKYQAKGGMMIVMNPKTGEILAWVVYPFYNPNYFNRYSPNQFRNRIITDSFEPGSTFKIITSVALLKEKLIDPEKTYFCPGYIKIGNKIIHCYRKQGHGYLNFDQIIVQSCNVGIIQCVKELSNRRFYSHILEFGLNKPTGIGLYGERKGNLPHPKYWSKLSKFTIAIGQGISVTPLGLITAVAAIPNNGVLMKPLIIKAIRSPEGKIIKEFKPTPVRQVISPELSQEMTNLLKKVVIEGTGKLAQINGYEIAGKTGTAQKVESSGGYSSNKFIASFIGYFPADNPKLIILVIVDEPKGIYWGGKVATPTFRQTAKRILSYMGVLPTEEYVATSSTSSNNML